MDFPNVGNDWHSEPWPDTFKITHPSPANLFQRSPIEKMTSILNHGLTPLIICSSPANLFQGSSP